MVNLTISLKIVWHLSCVENTLPTPHTKCIICWLFKTMWMSDDSLKQTRRGIWYISLWNEGVDRQKSRPDFSLFFASTSSGPSSCTRTIKKRGQGRMNLFSKIGERNVWVDDSPSCTCSHHRSTHKYVPYFILQHGQDKNYRVTCEAYDNDTDIIMVFPPFHLWIILCKQESSLNKSQGY